MNLHTKYLGLPLAHPIVPGASPMTDNLDTVRRLEDAGAPALVMHSLFEEQITQDLAMHETSRLVHEESYAEARSYFPSQEDYTLGPDQYLDQIQNIKDAVSIPVIASLNGIHSGAWIDYASLIEQAGADALELNVYFLATDASESGTDVERRIIDIVREVRSAVSLPITVKLSPYFSSLCHFAGELEAVGANGLVIFNRFYQPDIDLYELQVVPRLQFSTSAELRIRLRWAAILYSQMRGAIAVTGGVRTSEDIVKAIMAGATTVQTVAALLQNGPEYLRNLLQGLRCWMEENEYESLSQLRGSMSHRKCPNPEAFERANYLKTLQLWRD